MSINNAKMTGQIDISRILEKKTWIESALKEARVKAELALKEAHEKAENELKWIMKVKDQLITSRSPLYSPSLFSLRPAPY